MRSTLINRKLSMQLHVYNADDIAFIGKSPDLQCMLDTLHLWFVCLFGIDRPTRDFFTRTETSPLPGKGRKF